jgi:Kef-type K+ transport system membrane component KefB/mannitol/fructose-specific phosphotransferase system IIA component (Ntr-type)
VHHELLLFLLSLAVLLGVARLFGELCQRFGFPAVAGEILAGIVVGKTVLGRVAPAAFEWLFAEGPAGTLLTGYTTVAVMLLLVVAGLEIDLSVVKRSGRVVLLTASLGAVIPFAVGIGAGLVLPDSDLADPRRRLLHASFLGIALAISALPVIARTLLDLGLMKTEIGLIVLSAAVLNDLVGWIAFSVLSREFANGGSTSLAQVGASVGLTVVFVVGTLLIVRPLVDRALAFMQPSKTAEPPMGRVLSMVMVLALLGAAATHAFGMHAVFGGFVMGLAVGDSSRLREHTRVVLKEFVTSVFTPVFFATMALRFDFAHAFDLRLTAIVIALGSVAKIGGSALGARAGGVGWRQATAIGFGMNSRGAMEILLAVLALEARIIAPPLFVALVAMAIVTSLMSGPALVRLLRGATSPIVELLRRGVVIVDHPARARDDLIVALTASLAERLGRPADAALFAKKVLAREKLDTTGVGDGVAFPHAEIEGLEGPSLAFARTTGGLDFNAPDGKDVRLVFLLLTPPQQFERELVLLAAMACLVIQEPVRRGLLEAEDGAGVLSTLVAAGRAETTPASAAAGLAAKG